MRNFQWAQISTYTCMAPLVSIPIPILLTVCKPWGVGNGEMFKTRQHHIYTQRYATGRYSMEQPDRWHCCEAENLLTQRGITRSIHCTPTRVGYDIIIIIRRNNDDVITCSWCLQTQQTDHRTTWGALTFPSVSCPHTSSPSQRRAGSSLHCKQRTIHLFTLVVEVQYVYLVYCTSVYKLVPYIARSKVHLPCCKLLNFSYLRRRCHFETILNTRLILKPSQYGMGMRPDRYIPNTLFNLQEWTSDVVEPPCIVGIQWAELQKQNHNVTHVAQLGRSVLVM